MTRENYLGLLENALEQYGRYRSMYPREASIVFVVSQSVMSAIRAYEAGRFEALYSMFQDTRTMRTLVKLRGIDIYQVYGCEEDIFSPAFVWSEEAREIRLNNDRLLDADLLVDGNQLYIYDSGQQNYRETGYTVEAGIGAEYSYAGNLGNGNSWNWVDAISTASDYSALLRRSFNNKRKKAKVENELDPGDTKAIDDYLNSFTRHENQNVLYEA